MNKQHFDCIIHHVKLNCPNQRKPKYTPEYYLTNIVDLLTDFVKWSSLKKSVNYNNKFKYHYKTIADVHKLWSDKGIYKKAYNECVQKHVIGEGDKCINLLVDSTLIINKSGIEGIGYGTKCHKKKFTKLTAISTLDTENVAIIVDTVYTKDINLSDEKTMTIKTLSHDVKNIVPVIEDLRQTVPDDIKINLYGDKGYAMLKDDKTKLLKSHSVKLVNVKKSNQKKKNTKKEEKILKHRYKVENMFARITAYNRVHVRRDKTLACYMCFVYIACIVQFGKIN